MCFSLFPQRYTKSKNYYYLYFASVPKLYLKANLQIVIYIIFCGFKNGKSSIIEVLLTTVHRQGKKLLDFWVFFMVLQWVLLKLTLKQMMVLVLKNLVIFGTKVWNRFDRGSLHNPLVH